MYRLCTAESVGKESALYLSAKFIRLFEKITDIVRVCSLMCFEALFSLYFNQALMSRLSNTRTSASPFGMSVARTRFVRCGDIISRTHRYVKLLFMSSCYCDIVVSL